MIELEIVATETLDDRLEVRLEAGETVHLWEITQALRYRVSDPLPPRLLEQICGLIDGSVKKPTDQPPPNPLFERCRLAMMRFLYDRYLDWFTTRQQRDRSLRSAWHWRSCMST